MKRAILSSLPILVLLAGFGTALSQRPCKFDIVGSWESSPTGEVSPVTYRFAPNGIVTVVSRLHKGQSSAEREIGRAAYTLDNPGDPKTVLLRALRGRGVFPRGLSRLE